MELVEEIRVRLMPRMVKRDGRLDETVQFYRSRGRRRRRPSFTKEQAHEAQLGPEEEAEEDEGEEALVVMTPEVKDVADIPYFHPPVKQLAYSWTSSAPSPTDEVDDDSDVPPVRGRISVAYLPYPPDTTSVVTQAQAPAPSPFIPIPRRAAPRKRSPLAPAGSQAAEIIDEDGEATSQHRPRTPVGPERLQRTMLALLERIYKHGFGSMVGYVKRKHHDVSGLLGPLLGNHLIRQVVIQREKFQDLYLELKERHRHLDSRAPKPGSTKVEDVKRHVFKVSRRYPRISIAQDSANDKEDMGSPHSSLSPFHSISTTDLSSWGEQDVAIAAFLMLLWKDMYPARDPSPVKDVEEREWDCWGRPPGGFIDLGCVSFYITVFIQQALIAKGNGLLVHVLTSEGYYGRGYELRARRTWPLYPPGTREALVELSIDLPGWFPSTVAEWESGSWPGRDSCAIKEGAFLIGNHADELTVSCVIPGVAAADLSAMVALTIANSEASHPLLVAPVLFTYVGRRIHPPRVQPACT